MKIKSILLSLATIPFLIGCGGGGGSSTTTTSTPSATISGTVPGTKIEAFCDNGNYSSTTSNNNGTTRHPFTLDVKKGSSCYFVMTMNENNATQRTISIISFRDASGSESTRIQVTGDTIDLGYIDLPQDPTAMDDNNSDHVKDTPLVIDTPEGALDNNTSDTTIDSNQDGTPDVYEDDDHDGTPNLHDDSDGNGEPDYMEGNEHNGNDNNDNGSSSDNDNGMNDNGSRSDNDNGMNDNEHDGNDANDNDSNHDNNDTN